MPRKGAADRVGLTRFNEWERGYDSASIFGALDYPAGTWEVDMQLTKLMAIGKLTPTLRKARFSVVRVALGALFLARQSYDAQEDRQGDLAAAEEADRIAAKVEEFYFKQAGRIGRRDPDHKVLTERTDDAYQRLRSLEASVPAAASGLKRYADGLRQVTGGKSDLLARNFCTGVRRWWTEVTKDNHSLPAAMLRFAVALWLDVGFPMPDTDAEADPLERREVLTEWLRDKFKRAARLEFLPE